MYSANYSKRLVQFNSTTKYRSELELLHKLLEINRRSRILDYGCGIGTAMEYFSWPCSFVRGYDPNRFEDLVVPESWIQTQVDDKFDRIYFMHSIAHIPNIHSVVRKLVSDHLVPGGKIVVITPNKIWLREKNGGVDKKSDDTVIEHFTERTLGDLFLIAGLSNVRTGQFSVNSEDDVNGISERLYCVAD